MVTIMDHFGPNYVYLEHNNKIMREALYRYYQKYQYFCPLLRAIELNIIPKRSATLILLFFKAQ